MVVYRWLDSVDVDNTEEVKLLGVNIFEARLWRERIPSSEAR